MPICARSLARSVWLPYNSGQPQGRRLFCFPFAGGNASVYQSWGADLSQGIELCPVELPGRGTRFREPPSADLTKLTAHLLETLWDEFTEPFAFFGHSMGAIIAFELARRLEHETERAPAHLFASGRRAPHLASGKRLYDLPDDELIQELRILNGTPAEVLECPELLELMLPVVRADFRLIQTHRHLPAPPLRCPISAYGGIRDHTVPTESLEAWRRHTASTFKYCLFEGDHFYFSTSRGQMLSALCADLAETLQARSFARAC